MINLLAIICVGVAVHDGFEAALYPLVPFFLAALWGAAMAKRYRVAVFCAFCFALVMLEVAFPGPAPMQIGVLFAVTCIGLSLAWAEQDVPADDAHPQTVAVRARGRRSL